LILGEFYNAPSARVNLSASVRKGQKLVWSGTYNHNIIGFARGRFQYRSDRVHIQLELHAEKISADVYPIQQHHHASGWHQRPVSALLSTSSNGLLHRPTTTACPLLTSRIPVATSGAALANAFIVKYNYRFDF